MTCLEHERCLPPAWKERDPKNRSKTLSMIHHDDNHILLNKIRIEQSEGKKIWLAYGVSANPLHYGHLNYLHKIIDLLNPDKALLIPAKCSPFKQSERQINPEIKKKVLEAVIEGYEGSRGLNGKITLDYREIESQDEGPSYTYLTIHQLWQKAQQENAALYYLLSSETIETFYRWTYPAKIVEEATVMYGGRPEYPFDQGQLMSQLEAIDKAAREQGFDEIATSAEHAQLVQSGKIGDADVSILTAEGEERRVTIPAKAIRPIPATVLHAIRNGYLPITGDISISSTTIREMMKRQEPIDQYVGSKAARLMEEHQLYA